MDDCPQIRANAVVGRIVHKHCHSVRIFSDHLFHLGYPHPKRDTKMMIHIRIDIHRLCSAKHKRIDDAPVDVSGKDNLISLLTTGQYHALYCRRGPAHHQKCMGRPECFGCQFLCLFDHGNWMTKIVQRFHRIDVDPYTFAA